MSPTTFSNFAQEQILASGHILDGFIFFLFAQLLVYATYIIAIWAVTCLIKYLLNLSQSQSRLLGMCLWLLATVSVYFANQYYFPDSQFAFLRHMFGLFSHHGVNDLIFLIAVGLGIPVISEIDIALIPELELFFKTSSIEDSLLTESEKYLVEYFYYS